MASIFRVVFGGWCYGESDVSYIWYNSRRPYIQNTLHRGFIIIIIIKKGWQCKAERESDIHPISPKTPAPQYQPIDRKKRKEKRIEDYGKDREAWANKKALALLLKPASPTQSNTGLARSFQRDTERGIKVLLYYEVLQRGGA